MMIETVYVAPKNVAIVHIVTGHEGDTGRLIGKQGRMTRSIRTIISARSMKDGLRLASK